MGATYLARRLPYNTKTFSLDPVCAMSALTMSRVLNFSLVRTVLLLITSLRRCCYL